MKNTANNNFNSLKNNQKLSRFEAYFDLINNFSRNFRTTTPELAKRWKWKHHSRVINLLNHLVKKGEIITYPTNKDTHIKLLK